MHIHMVLAKKEKKLYELIKIIWTTMFDNFKK